MSAAIALLPEDQRQAVELRHLLGMAVAEIAVQMERTDIAVSGLIRRGLKRLREVLTANGGDSRD